VWYATDLDVNAEVNNGRGPVDFKISKGTDKTLVEFKLAKNSKLKQNLKNQVKIYEAANDTKQSLTVILYHTDEELKKVRSIIKDLDLEKNENIILIDACDDKPSASNVK
jgi:vacuolar-type H+-ATPase subunit I/STV1